MPLDIYYIRLLIIISEFKVTRISDLFSVQGNVPGVISHMLQMLWIVIRLKKCISFTLPCVDHSVVFTSYAGIVRSVWERQGPMRMSVLIKPCSLSAESLITGLGVHAMGLLQAERETDRERKAAISRGYLHTYL